VDEMLSHRRLMKGLSHRPAHPVLHHIALA
jgi:hypothetical protein